MKKATRGNARLGRKTRLAIQPSLTNELCKHLRKGQPIRTCCELVGLAESTLYDYVRRALRTSDDYAPEFAEFAERVTRARADGKRRLVDMIVASAGSDWRAASWLLERCYPQEFGRTERAASTPGEIQPTPVFVTINTTKRPEDVGKFPMVESPTCPENTPNG